MLFPYFYPDFFRIKNAPVSHQTRLHVSGRHFREIGFPYLLNNCALEAFFPDPLELNADILDVRRALSQHGRHAYVNHFAVTHRGFDQNLFRVPENGEESCSVLTDKLINPALGGTAQHKKEIFENVEIHADLVSHGNIKLLLTTHGFFVHGNLKITVCGRNAVFDHRVS